MKKILILCGVFFFAEQVHAQKGMEVTIKNFVPDEMEILPGLYEFFGPVTKGGKGESYVLTTNEELVQDLKDSAHAGSTIAFFGPTLETLAKNKCIEDYKKKRKEIEDEARAWVIKEKQQLASAKEGSEKISARQDVRIAKKELLHEKWNTFVYVMKLRKIVKRYKVNCIYAYNYSAGTAPEGQKNTPKKADDEEIKRKLGIK